METIKLGNCLGKTNLQFGKGLPTLINFIVGVNTTKSEDILLEKRKIDMAIENGVHTITDLSTIRLDQPLWLYIKEKYPQVGVGINPPYLVYGENNKKIPPQILLNEIKNFVLGGGDQMTLNFFPRTPEDLKILGKDRLVPITGRQGGMMAVYMNKYSSNNPLYEIMEDVIEILKRYGVVLHLGATFRPAGIYEANDYSHNWEIEQQFELYKKFDKIGVKSVLEIMSHQPLHSIGVGIENLRKRYGGYIPFQLLGPMVTDFVDQYDNISAAIGMAEAARYNVGKVTTVPPREHSGFPSFEDSFLGIKSAKIAVHAGDLTRIPDLIDVDKEILKSRSEKITCNIESNKKGCEKCGKYCPLVITKKIYE